MKQSIKRRLRLAGWMLLLPMLFGSAAQAEIARVQTAGGPVKMRSQASTKTRIVTTIPNKTYIEVEEADEEWCLVTYKGKSGYVMSEYLLLSSDLAESQPAISFSPETPTVGCVMDITVSCPEAVSYAYSITRVEGKTVTGEQTPLHQVSYSPRKPGIYCLEVTASLADGSTKNNMAFFDVAAAEEDVRKETVVDGITLYSQKDGWWLDKKYRTSDLDTSGCAIFTLSHAMQLLGHQSPTETPENLAKTYAYCLVDGGTLNSTLIGAAAKNYQFTTKYDLIHAKQDIVQYFSQGAVFSFAIVRGHIALCSGISEDGTKVKIIDSAPSATFSRLPEGEAMYLLTDTQEWQPITDLSQMPGARYFFETNQYNGMEYYLDFDYVAKRGVRLILPKNKET